MEQDQQSRWRPTRRQVLWIVGIVVAVCVLYVLIRIGYALPGTGFGQSKAAQDVRPAKTLWDWMDLLIVPVVLATGGYLFTRSESRATQAAAERRAQEEALQAYLDHMSQMLMPNNDQPTLHDESPPDSLKTVARARTLTALPRLTADRKARVVQFLYESGLIIKGRTIVDLAGAELIGADLAGANLSFANLSQANLSGVDLSNADLSFANLSFANLEFGADLRGADLREANLRGTHLWDVNLSEANLSGADLSDADLGGAYLSFADLMSAEQLTRAKSLNSATMPDGRVLKGPENPNGPTFEEWRKSREGQG